MRITLSVEGTKGNLSPSETTGWISSTVQSTVDLGNLFARLAIHRDLVRKVLRMPSIFNVESYSLSVRSMRLRQGLLYSTTSSYSEIISVNPNMNNRCSEISNPIQSEVRKNCF